MNVAPTSSIARAASTTAVTKTHRAGRKLLPVLVLVVVGVVVARIVRAIKAPLP